VQVLVTEERGEFGFVELRLQQIADGHQEFASALPGQGGVVFDLVDGAQTQVAAHHCVPQITRQVHGGEVEGAAGLLEHRHWVRHGASVVFFVDGLSNASDEHLSKRPQIIACGGRWLGGV
jgi:hypothetical protein